MQREKQTQAEEVSDEVLVAQALAGEQRGFEALVQRYQRPLLHCICTYLGDRDQASDVLQQVLLQLMEVVGLSHLRHSAGSHRAG